MNETRHTVRSAGSPGMRLWLCPCCDTYGLEVGNLLLRISAADLGGLRSTLWALLADELPRRFALTLAEGITLLLTPHEARQLATILGNPPGGSERPLDLGSAQIH